MGLAAIERYVAPGRCLPPPGDTAEARAGRRSARRDNPRMALRPSPGGVLELDEVPGQLTCRQRVKPRASPSAIG